MSRLSARLVSSAVALVFTVVLAALPFGAGAIDFSAAGNPVSIRTHSLKTMHFQQVLRQQYDFSCGSAAVATLLTHHYKMPLSEQEAFDEMFANGDQAKIRSEGFSLLDMKRLLADRALDADGFEVGLDALAQERIPAIALIQDNGYHHFVVIKGVQKDRVLIGDPSLGVRALPRSKFEALWASKVLFVIHNHRDRAGFNRAEDWALTPSAPLAQSVMRNGLDGATMPRLGPGEF